MSRKISIANSPAINCRKHLKFEALEDRLCLSSINGYVWHDMNSNGANKRGQATLL